MRSDSSERAQHTLDADEELIEAAVRLARRTFGELVDKHPTFFYVAEFGASGRWLHVTPEIQTILGYEPSDWLRDENAWLEHIHPDDRSSALVDEILALAERRPLVSQYRFRRRDGRYFDARDEGFVVHSSLGRPVLAGAIADLST